MVLRKALLLVLLIGLPSCSSPRRDDAEPGGREEEAEPALSPVQEKAVKVFKTRCAVCHGEQGAGDGPGSQALRPRPRNLRDPAWQGSVDDDFIERIIRLGGTGVGRSAAMPPNPDLASKPELVKALREHVRSLAPR